MIDIVVASPGRLMQHKQQSNVFLSQVNTVIIDEVDTMLTQGFGSDIRAILRSVLKKRDNGKKSNFTKDELVFTSCFLVVQWMKLMIQILKSLWQQQR